eukprot:TRINITY_DN12595_c0_g1_i1.p1 TRINITY_DN12595_c0_g1~~TRINITY_DN12595_c0_g1_i1.p1  ORF type:complete len:549 (+),score=156.43 TRINITY_DN12595_c0_g1_i1:51-1649(+)
MAALPAPPQSAPAGTERLDGGFRAAGLNSSVWDPRRPPPGCGRGGINARPAAPPSSSATTFSPECPGGRGGVGSNSKGFSVPSGRGGVLPAARRQEGLCAALRHGRPPVLPYDTPVRTALDVAWRHPQRPIVDDLVSVTACWASLPPGVLLGMLHRRIRCRVPPDPIPPSPPPQPSGDVVNARALLVLGLSAGQAHVLRRVSVLACKPLQKRGCAYGGLVPAGDDGQVVESLRRLLAAQSGVSIPADGVQWHKLLEFRYDGRPNTVVFVPDLQPLAEAGIEPRRVELETSAEGGGGEDMTEAARAAKPGEAIHTPLEVTLAHVLESNIGSADDADAAELVGAVDMLDDWLRKDAAGKLVSVLKRKRGELREEDAADEAEAAALKKRRAEQDAARDREYEERRAALEAGSGSAEKQLGDLAEERAAAVRLVTAQRRREDLEVKTGLLPAVAGEPRYRRHRVRDATTFHCFQVFDRRPGFVTSTHELSTEHLARSLLALGGRTLAECRRLARVTPRDRIDYGHVAGERRVDAVP